MPSLKDIRSRIGSVRNIAQITRAMEMVAASRMKRAQDSILAARPYADELEEALGRVAGAAGLTEEINPLLARRPVRRPEISTLLPVAQPEMGEETERTNDEYLFEPSPEAVLRRLLPHYVAIGIYRAVLENNASEQSARMIAMRNSTDNANELIDDLTLVYNKTRQATITREMIEIASGAEALGG